MSHAVLQQCLSGLFLLPKAFFLWDVFPAVPDTGIQLFLHKNVPLRAGVGLSEFFSGRPY